MKNWIGDSQLTMEFLDRYKPLEIERAAYALGRRQTRYRGIKQTPLHHIAIATDINLQRCMDWSWEVPHTTTYISHFARLALAA